MHYFLISFLPEEFWLPILVIAGLLVILGFRKLGLGIYGAILLMALLTPFMDSLIAQLSQEIFWILMGVFFFSMLRLILGRRVMENVLSYLIYDLIRAPFRFLAWLLQGGRRIPRG
jgi:hypothetical protein